MGSGVSRCQYLRSVLALSPIVCMFSQCLPSLIDHLCAEPSHLKVKPSLLNQPLRLLSRASPLSGSPVVTSGELYISFNASAHSSQLTFC